ncbi:MAG: ATP-binding cassette domain-containing protein [Treponema sp.]|jgi:peptide/nickel transport system ATP-binding protein|nr:ATP-binding cassette domain-containing protein [Treponema sp.]
MLFEVKDIRFGYGKGRPVLNKVSFSLNAGERVALVGPSGCGKSTLARIMAGYLAPDTGETLFAGKPLPTDGYCPVQLIYQHPEKAVNPRWKMGKTLSEGWKADDAFLASMGIEKPWLARYPQELSGGEIQRFCIARALGPDARLIIADEMTTMLDVITQAQIWNVMLDMITRRNMGLLVITHNPYLAEQICGRIVPFEEINGA